MGPRVRGDDHYFRSIGGAIFSAGAGGNGVPVCGVVAGTDPVVWPGVTWGRAGSGAGVVGRVPPGSDSAGFAAF